MSDLKITEFRERAEVGLDIPELDVIERKGRALRRRRVTAAAGGLALVLLVGLGITRIATDPGDRGVDAATPLSPAPGALWNAPGVRTTFDQGEVVLLPGPSEVVYGEAAVRFDVPSEDWEWWGAGMGLRRNADDPDAYGAAVFFLLDASARLQPCSDERVEALGADPNGLVANISPLLDLAHATVQQAPRVVTAFGAEAVHLRLQTNDACLGDGDGDRPAQLRGVLDGVDIEPGWPGKHVLDVWHVVVPGADPASLLVASWDLNETGEHRDQQRALLDSIQINAG